MTVENAEPELPPTDTPSELDDSLSSLADLYKEDAVPDDTSVTDDVDTSEDAPEPEETPDDDILEAFKDVQPEATEQPAPVQQPSMPQLTPQQMAEIQEFEQWRQQKAQAQQQAQRDAIPVPEILPEDFNNAFDDVDGMRNLLLKNNQTVVQAVEQMVGNYIQQMQAQTLLHNEYMVLLSLAGEKEPHLYEHPEALAASLRKVIAPGKDPRDVVTETIKLYNKNYGMFQKMSKSHAAKKFDIAPKGKSQAGQTRTRPTDSKQADRDPWGFGALFNAYRKDD
jgi:hypothetical protein